MDRMRNLTDVVTIVVVTLFCPGWGPGCSGEEIVDHVDTVALVPDAAAGDGDMAPPADACPSALDVNWPRHDPPPPGWYNVDEDLHSVENGRIGWRYQLGYLHDGPGMAIRQFVDKETGEDLSGGFDAIFMGFSWDRRPVVFDMVVPGPWSVDIHVTTGLTRKIDRIYYGFPGVEIEYLVNDAEWVEDFFHVQGDEEEDIAFVMYGMNDIVGMAEGQRLWKASEDLARMKFNQRVNRGDTFIEAAGATVEGCTYKGRFIYGFVNRITGRGVGAVYDARIGVPNFRVWWTEKSRIEIEYAPDGQLGKRWIFAVKEGKAEVMSMGRFLIDNDGYLTP